MVPSERTVFVLLPYYHCASLFAGKQKSHKEKCSPVLKDDDFGSAVSHASLTSVLCLVRSSCWYFCAALLDSLMLSTPFEMSCWKKKYQLDLKLFFQLTSSGLSANSQPAHLLLNAEMCPAFKVLQTLFVALLGTVWFDLNSKDMGRKRLASIPTQGRLK